MKSNLLNKIKFLLEFFWWFSMNWHSHSHRFRINRRAALNTCQTLTAVNTIPLNTIRAQHVCWVTWITRNTHNLTLYHRSCIAFTDISSQCASEPFLFTKSFSTHQADRFVPIRSDIKIAKKMAKSSSEVQQIDLTKLNLQQLQQLKNEFENVSVPIWFLFGPPTHTHTVRMNI